MDMRPCRCIGDPLAFDPDSCFRCGHLLPDVAADLAAGRAPADVDPDPDGMGDLVGSAALWTAVMRQQLRYRADECGVDPDDPDAMLAYVNAGAPLPDDREGYLAWLQDGCP